MNKKGFTLAELLIAVGILAVAILGLLALFVNVMLMNESNYNLVTAVNDAQFVLEQMRPIAYDDLDDYSPPDFINLQNETESVTVSNPPGGSIAEITVTIGWTERNRNRNFQLSTRFVKQ
ncbi:MAG: prepilin-type N-terminal cleavage/methylation domain-containing protein [Candidatus Omnitrophota bacterium]